MIFLFLHLEFVMGRRLVYSSSSFAEQTTPSSATQLLDAASTVSGLAFVDSDLDTAELGL